VGETGRIEGKSPLVGTAENGPDAPETKSTAASPPLADIAARINKAHDRASASARSTIEAAMEAGSLLIQAKDQVGHGGWLPWLKANTSVNKRTAQGYMKLARELDKSAVSAHLTVDGALKMLSTPEDDPKQRSAHRSAASPKSSKVEVLPPKPKPPGSSSNLLTNENLVDRIRSDVEAAERRGIDIANLVLGLPALDPETSVAPLRISADPEAENNHRPSPVTDGVNMINGNDKDADTADDTNELDVHYGPLTGRQWIALSKCLYMHDPQGDPHDRRPGEPQYCPEFLQLVKVFNVPFARWMDRIMVGNAMEPCFSQEDDTDHAEGVE
jgi:hypothetical protein